MCPKREAKTLRPNLENAHVDGVCVSKFVWTNGKNMPIGK